MLRRLIACATADTTRFQVGSVKTPAQATAAARANNLLHEVGDVWQDMKSLDNTTLDLNRGADNVALDGAKGYRGFAEVDSFGNVRSMNVKKDNVTVEVDTSGFLTEKQTIHVTREFFRTATGPMIEEEWFINDGPGGGKSEYRHCEYRVGSLLFPEGDHRGLT